MPNWCPATVIEKKVWCDGLFTLKVHCPAVQHFEPGQFLHLALEHEGHLVNRPYSVASPHGEELDFFIVKVEGGHLTPLLWELEPGHAVQVSERAAGSFTLSKSPDRPCLWLMATGTGLAPYIAMLRESAVWQRFQKIIVVHGVRYLPELGYREWLTDLAAEKAGKLVYVPMVTRDSTTPFIRSRITNAFAEGRLEAAAGCQISAENSAVMLCGNPDMLNELEAQLIQQGLTKHRHKTPGNIVVERYW